MVSLTRTFWIIFVEEWALGLNGEVEFSIVLDQLNSWLLSMGALLVF